MHPRWRAQKMVSLCRGGAQDLGVRISLDCNGLTQGTVRSVDQYFRIGRDRDPIGSAREGGGPGAVRKGEARGQWGQGGAAQADDKQAHHDYNAQNHHGRQDSHEAAQDAQIFRFGRGVNVFQADHL